MTRRVGPDMNIEAFQEASSKLRADGHFVIDPSEQPKGLDYNEYMRFDLSVIINGVDGVVVLPYWEIGPGAVVEVATAVSVGLPVWSYHKNPELHANLTLLFASDVGVRGLRQILKIEPDVG